ncbi:MAG: hypothetical protein UX44_C0010G0014 [candidate division WWE3 bacterium GW2011_GWA1_46_21]|uniref:Bacterial membrane protein YfhO n=3 Tax=Katanobacteria TaxID=422282 RepID=A0A0G1PE08_UNCKA|nr:MAG: hypothetical protein UX44_C0010G0014 [candidate division WWE3 bacterium GW2011_GWA1_46_21]KKU51078.1 MAG: hypothetical protein UX73_C0008G0019 [candidate division WWE3 bacterium GW2011_GWC1_47_10]KKU57614.1 MAG: hypothetical protein UX79_C0007G0005 [candidate division WWE3 bacterium GW2011_GWB1_47_11]
MKNTALWAVGLSIVAYLLFFSSVLDPNLTIYSGKDSVFLHYPFRFYLHEKLTNGEFPFWTERIFMGFPIYADVESGYLNLINVLLVALTGPIWSYKILHFLAYLLGSLSLFHFLKQKGGNLLGFWVANLVYFFSFFLLYHQQHFNMILTFYTLPTAILLANGFVLSKSWKPLLLAICIFAFQFYLGSIQAVFITIMAYCVFLLLHVDKKCALKAIVTTVFGFIVLILPTVLPTADLFLNSQRQTVGVSFTEGSFSPLSVVNLVVPFAFGSDKNYFGTAIDEDYLKHETYVYFGLSALLVALVGMHQVSDQKLRNFLYCAVALFLVLGFIRYIPLLNKTLPFPFDAFRYWGRSVVLLLFAVAVAAGSFVSSSKKPVIRRLATNLIPLAFITLLLVVNVNDKTIVNTYKYFVHRTQLSTQLLILAAIFIVTSAAIFVRWFSNSKKVLSAASVCLAAIITVDLIYFGFQTLDDMFRPGLGIAPLAQQDNSFANKRVINPDGDFERNKGLYYKQWGIFGYSQFAPGAVIAGLSRVGLNSIKDVYSNADLTWEILSNIGKYAGADSVTKNKIVAQVNTKFLEASAGEISNIVLEEGHISATIMSGADAHINTFVRNDPGWKLTVDGRNQSFTNQKSALFLEFNLGAGNHQVELTYIPTKFYIGVFLAAALGVTLVWQSKINPGFFKHE